MDDLEFEQSQADRVPDYLYDISETLKRIDETLVKLVGLRDKDVINLTRPID